MTPQTLARVVLERENVEKIFAQMAILETVDVELTDAGFRLLSLLRQKRVVDVEVSLGYEEIALAMTWSRPKTIRTMNHLLKLAYFTVRKRHNKRNCYTLRGPDEKRAAERCARCRRDRPTGPTGVCVVCRKAETARREVAEHFAVHGASTLKDVWADLKSSGSKSSQKDIQRAYNSALDAAAVSA